jgi:hypothetical protein
MSELSDTMISNLVTAIGDLKTEIGLLKAGQDNVLRYIATVSAKTDKVAVDLAQHIQDKTEAHGEPAAAAVSADRGRIVDRIAMWTGLVLSLGLLIVELRR